jgi:hypothetical protein
VGPRVFVSRTREAGPERARRLVTGLNERLGSDRVTGVGEDAGSQATIKEQIDGCEVLIAAIGPGWLGSQDGFAEEVALGLARRIPVIPVLSPGASVPRREALPDTIKALLNNHPRLTIEIASDFYSDVTVGHLARWLTAIATENQMREDRRQKAAATCRRLEREVRRAAEKLAAAETAATAAENEHARLEKDLQTATEELATRQREIDPTRVGGGIRVFISYRPETSADARKLESDLRARLERGRVFSTEPVPEGAQAAVVIGERIARCDVLLAIIGPSWLTTTGAHGTPRLEDPVDPIRLEIGAGLERGIPVVPMLTQHASKPNPDALPDALRPLGALPAFELLVPFWNDGIDDIVARLKEIGAQIRERETVKEAAADRHRKLDREAKKAAQQQADTAAALAAATGKLAELEQSLQGAREEQDRRNAEPDDENSAFLEGPARDIGTTSRAKAARVELIGRRGRPDRNILLVGGVIVAIILLVVILSSGGH